MRVWDVHPGYLNRQGLLGEHREIHALIAIIAEKKTGYSRHPETRRWRRHLWALRKRHEVVVAEMRLRGYRHLSPAPHRGPSSRWPTRFLNEPGRQLALLKEKYATTGKGQIPLPRSAQELWAHHKYSVLARARETYEQIGRRVAAPNEEYSIDNLAVQMVEILRRPPTPGCLRDALFHMWGYVSGAAGPKNGCYLPDPRSGDLGGLLARIWRFTYTIKITYLMHSTALSDLAVWV
jgi:hypothetical protein